jgi:hypothetical protein
MKKNFFAIAFFVLLSIISNAQNSTSEDLQRQLASSKKDTAHVLLLEQLSKTFWNSKPDSALLLAQQGLKLCKGVGKHFAGIAASRKSE